MATLGAFPSPVSGAIPPEARSRTEKGMRRAGAREKNARRKECAGRE